MKPNLTNVFLTSQMVDGFQRGTRRLPMRIQVGYLHNARSIVLRLRDDQKVKPTAILLRLAPILHSVSQTATSPPDSAYSAQLTAPSSQPHADSRRSDLSAADTVLADQAPLEETAFTARYELRPLPAPPPDSKDHRDSRTDSRRQEDPRASRHYPLPRRSDVDRPSSSTPRRPYDSREVERLRQELNYLRVRVDPVTVTVLQPI
jgi:hypothetical protein